jgi:hypothetical protein
VKKQRRFAKNYPTGRAQEKAVPWWQENEIGSPFSDHPFLFHKGKWSALVSRQAALTSRMCTGSTWELSSNYILDRKDPGKIALPWSIIMDIPSSIFPSTPLFHSVDAENEPEARSVIAGLIPFLKELHSTWFLKFFTEEAKIRHAASKWVVNTRSAYSAKEAELDIFFRRGWGNVHEWWNTTGFKHHRPWNSNNSTNGGQPGAAPQDGEDT